MCRAIPNKIPIFFLASDEAAASLSIVFAVFDAEKRIVAGSLILELSQIVVLGVHKRPTSPLLY
ncbi:hypothetical protein QC763_123305 [Podospora pseudopauciseta]|uniref:Uncharacterized protein n=1 Tax=Podospora pseudopauciseta TaxID=2093780 RepID=A0ABR0I2Y6_9PEZI|nr:hypothetical protein QC763_123305 [Podospora pseudopauciseta]